MLSCLLDSLLHVDKEFVSLTPKKGVIGKEFRQDAKAVTEALLRMDSDEIRNVNTQLNEIGSVQGSTLTLLM